MLDLEAGISRVWNPDLRAIVGEAQQCYNSGAARAAIVLTWSAVCADLIEKISRLADDGEKAAEEVSKQIDQLRAQHNAQAVKLMQDVERSLLDTAEKLELIDFVEHRELERLREDRHLCAHPSMRPLGEPYAPTLEYARAHLATALEALLVHPPVQGRNALRRFQELIDEDAFTPDAEYLIHRFYERVKPAARRQIIALAAKHAMLELDVPGQDARRVADRMAECLMAFATRDRELVRTVLETVAERLSTSPPGIQVTAVGRLADLDVFWSAVHTSTFRNVDQQIQLINPEEDNVTDDDFRLMSTVAIDVARAKLPGLEGLFRRLSSADVTRLVAHRPGTYFVEHLPRILEEAPSFRGAESRTQRAVLPSARFLSVDSLQAVLTAWAENYQCREAGDMVKYSVDLFHATKHLRPHDLAVWRAFLEAVQDAEPSTDYYSYQDLAELVLQ